MHVPPSEEVQEETRKRHWERPIEEPRHHELLIAYLFVAGFWGSVTLGAYLWWRYG